MCIGRYIKSKIDENISSIKCPKLDCGKSLTPLECRPIIPSALFVKWSDALCRSYVSAYASCSCPYQNCSELILNECNEETTKCACPRCKRLICYKCRVPWHAGFKCGERSQERDVNDARFDLLVKKLKWTRCPRCGQSIERVGGCRFVECRCHTIYCHQCGSERCYSSRGYAEGCYLHAIDKQNA
ncbi:E3 ubiquitin-protein ligase RSL1-like [Salvia hispanica]|uniref:E3 ubiquitin-protein ligase RSL1-like n=1 Tax=Salvia hispanica TaxID=49212 RepID=UPI0020091E13|nr:E3 ubiquitin-protein ligase RSL1-like [Salvia hispanica]